MEVIMPEDNLAQFKKILANLPEDRRKRLYDRLHAMPASQREAFINDFTRKSTRPKRQVHRSRLMYRAISPLPLTPARRRSLNPLTDRLRKHSLQMVRRSLSPQLFRLRSLSLLTVRRRMFSPQTARRSLLQAASLRISIPPLPSGTKRLTSMALK